jgi:hypothetical protein
MSSSILEYIIENGLSYHACTFHKPEGLFANYKCYMCFCEAFECQKCGVSDCPQRDKLHYSKYGCPSCGFHVKKTDSE